MANVLHKTADPVDYRTSVNTPEFPTADWFINPDVSAVAAVPTKYWARPLADPVGVMTQPEQDAVDAAELAATIVAAQAEAKDPLVAANDGDGIRLRARFESQNKRDNYIINRLIELQNRVQAMLDSNGPIGNMRSDGLAVSISATNTRTRADAIQDFRDLIDANEVNAGE